MNLKLTKTRVLGFLSILFSMIATLAFIPKIIVSVKDKVEIFQTQKMTYSDINFAFTVALITLFSLVALICFVKQLYLVKKNNGQLTKEQKISLVLVSLALVVVLVNVIYTAVLYSTWESKILDLTVNDKLLDEPALTIARENNDKIKYILLSFVFIYFAILLANIVFYFLNKKAKKGKN